MSGDHRNPSSSTELIKSVVLSNLLEALNIWLNIWLLNYLRLLASNDSTSAAAIK